MEVQARAAKTGTALKAVLGAAPWLWRGLENLHAVVLGLVIATFRSAALTTMGAHICDFHAARLSQLQVRRNSACVAVGGDISASSQTCGRS